MPHANLSKEEVVSRLMRVFRREGYDGASREGEVSLAPYPQLRAWLARIEALPGFVAMPASKVGLAA